MSMVIVMMMMVMIKRMMMRTIMRMMMMLRNGIKDSPKRLTNFIIYFLTAKSAHF